MGIEKWLSVWYNFKNKRSGGNMKIRNTSQEATELQQDGNVAQSELTGKQGDSAQIEENKDTNSNGETKLVKRKFTADEKMFQDIDLVTSAHDSVFAIKYKYLKVRDTKYKNWPFRDIIKQFDNKDFYALPEKDIRDLCSEVNQKVAHTLKILPSYIGFVDKSDALNEDAQMECCNYKNRIRITRLDDENPIHGYAYLYNILHETYHSYQFQQIDRLMRNMPFDASCIIGNLNMVINDTRFFYTSKNMDEDRKRECMSYQYNTDLLETSANLFAYNMMKKLYEKKYLTNEVAYEYNQSRLVDCMNFQLNFTEDDISFLKEKTLKNFRTLESAKNRYISLFDDEVKRNLGILSICTAPSIVKNYLDNVYSNIMNIRINEREKTKFFGQFSFDDFLSLNKMVCDNEVAITPTPLDEIRNRYYMYGDKDLKLPLGRDLEEELKYFDKQEQLRLQAKKQGQKKPRLTGYTEKERKKYEKIKKILYGDSQSSQPATQNTADVDNGKPVDTNGVAMGDN